MPRAIDAADDDRAIGIALDKGDDDQHPVDQEDYAQKMIDEYKAAGVGPLRFTGRRQDAPSLR